MTEGKEPNTTDESLVRRIRGGEQDAATQLYMRYAKRLARLARAQTPSALGSRIDPEDVVQSVFRTFFRRVAIGQYDIPAGEDLWKLLLVMSLNKVRKLGAFHRAAKRDVAATSSLDAANEGGAATDESALRMLELTITEVLGELPALHAPVIELRIQGHDVAEIAARTSRSKRTVERILQDFRKRLALEVEHDADGGGPEELS